MRIKQNKNLLTPEERMAIVLKASKQVGPGVFYSTIILLFCRCFYSPVWKVNYFIRWHGQKLLFCW
jgi:Cu/Ag efflux pump CusA